MDLVKHLRVLEDAGLAGTRRSGREKQHFLNPVPIRLIHDRWIHKFKHELEGEVMASAAEVKVSPKRGTLMITLSWALSHRRR